jgi:hypothetical protein
MNNHEPQLHPTIERSMQRSFVHALTWVMIGWSIVTSILLFTIDLRNTPMFTDTLVIAVASGVIACVSVLPGMLMQFVVPKGAAGCQSAEPWGRLTAALAVGMMIRSIGTVALFLTYRYHLASSTEMIAGMTLGWYVFLTSIEVLVLARTLPKSAQPTAGEVSIRVDTSLPVKV